MHHFQPDRISGPGVDQINFDLSMGFKVELILEQD